jgi:hypothetical protein
MTKLIQEQKQFVTRLQHANHHSTHYGSPTNNQLKSTVKKQHHTVFTKVVLRCIIYPLGKKRNRPAFFYFSIHNLIIVPFLVNIFGFVNQLTIAGTKQPTFTMVVMSTIFSSIGGFLVALVFFTDPAITSGISHIYKNLQKKYVQEYTVILCEKASNHDKPLDIYITTSTVASSVQSPLLPLNYATLRAKTIYEIRPVSTVSADKSLSSGEHTKIIMRRVELNNDASHYHSQTHVYSAESSNVTIPHHAVVRNTNPIDSSSPLHNAQYSFIPYKHPWMASVARFILTGFGTRSKKEHHHQPYDYPPLYELSNTTLLNYQIPNTHLYTTSM